MSRVRRVWPLPFGLGVLAVGCLVIAPLPVTAGVWLVLAVVGAWAIVRAGARAARTVARGTLLAALALAAYGLFVMAMQARSAARGGGLVGGLGEMLVALAVVLGVLGAVALGLLARRREG